jgi:thiol-disulfide isomerase/thioredoxin
MNFSLENANEVSNQVLNKISKVTRDKESPIHTISLIHATWCGHCVTFKPEWEKLRKSKKFNTISIESSVVDKVKAENPKVLERLSRKEGLYFPMIHLFIKKGDKVKKVLFEGNRSAEEIEETIKKMSASKSKAKKTENKTPKTKKTKKGGKEENVESLVQNVIDRFFKL